MRQWYGERITNQYGDVPPPDWCDLIDRTDDERLEDGMLAVRRESPVHPPTLGQLESKIPSRRYDNGTRYTAAEILCEWGAWKLRSVLCKHQFAKTWSYFGPAREFVSQGGGLVTHADVRGAVIPACTECNLGTHRVLLDEVPEGFNPGRKQGQFA